MKTNTKNCIDCGQLLKGGKAKMCKSCSSKRSEQHSRNRLQRKRKEDREFLKKINSLSFSGGDERWGTA